MQSLRHLSRIISRGVTESQKRSYKDLPTKKNPYVEEWYNAREDMELKAQITPTMLAAGAFWGFVVPYFAYECIVAEMRQSDKLIGRNTKFFPQPIEDEEPTSSE
jgi:hypothetical protein